MAFYRGRTDVWQRAKHRASSAALLWVAVPGWVLAQMPAAADCKPFVGWKLDSCSNCVTAVTGETKYYAEPTIKDFGNTTPRSAKGETLHYGDVVVAVDDQLITTGPAWDLLNYAKPGTVLQITVRRAGQQVVVPVPVTRVCSPKSAGADSTGWRSLAASPRVNGAAGGLALDPAMGARGTIRMPFAARGPDSTASALAARNFDAFVLQRGEGTSLRFGLGLACSSCTGISSAVGSTTLFSFSAAPVVNFVVRGGPGDRAGIHVGDTIETVNDTRITSNYGGQLFSGARPGERLSLRLKHGPESRTVQVTASGGSYASAGTLAPATKSGVFLGRDSAQLRALPRAGGATAKSTVAAQAIGGQEYFLGGVVVTVDSGAYRVKFDTKTQEMVFTLSDGQIMRVKVVKP